MSTEKYARGISTETMAISEYLVDTGNKVTKEMKQMKLVDNPLDAALYHTLELSREIVYYATRLRDYNCPNQVKPKEEDALERIGLIIAELDKLFDKNVSDETISMIRKHSFVHENEQDLLDVLFTIEQDIPTVFTQSEPCRNIDYERYCLGITSEEYNRLLFLRGLAINDDFTNIGVSVLKRMLDLVDQRDSSATLSKMDKYLLDLADNYSLGVEEIEYLIEYRKLLDKDLSCQVDDWRMVRH